MCAHHRDRSSFGVNRMDAGFVDRLTGKGKLVAVTDDLLALADADKHISVIDDRNKVLAHGRNDQILDRCIDPNGSGTRSAVNFRGGLFFGRAEIAEIMILNIPKKIALGDYTDVFAFPRNDGDCGILMVLHFLQCLPKGIIVI